MTAVSSIKSITSRAVGCKRISNRFPSTLANLGYKVCDQTIGNVLQRYGLPPAPERKPMTTWPAFIRTHLALLAGTDFFTEEVLTLRGLVTY